MSELKSDWAGLVRGLLGLEKDGSMPRRPVSGPSVEIRTRYFVAVNASLMDGSHAFRVLTSYVHTLPAAERELEVLRSALPVHAKPEIFWCHSTYDLSDAAQVRELGEVDAAAAAERAAEGVQ